MDGNKEKLLETIEGVARAIYQKELRELTKEELNYAVARGVIGFIAPGWMASRNAKERKAYYFSAEYLIGRMVFNNLQAIGMLEEVTAMLRGRGVELSALEDVEAAVVGNGGLGRLAACFLDSASVQGIPLQGYGIKYRYGLFYQKIENGFQSEIPDDWGSDTNPWFLRKESDAVNVRFADGEVRAVPYDMPVIGFGSSRVNTLRLWQAEAVREFDFQRFNEFDYAGAVEERYKAEMITYVLYPNDSTREGKELRLKQQYFFTSASLQDLLRQYRRLYQTGDLDGFVECTAIQLNDTHPAVAIPELIRLLMREGVAFERAFGMAQDIFSYTNHTIMSEALEKWDIDIFRGLLPEVYEVIERIHARLMDETGAGRADEFAILKDGQIHMARLAIYGSSYVNGVARIHTDILKNREMRAWYERYPERFLNKTNGVTQRRWLALCNPELAGLVTEKIGGGWVTDFPRIRGIEQYIGDDGFVRAFNDVKRAKKRQLAAYIKKRDGYDVNPDTVFDIQVKRLHEYKRQLLNAFSAMDFYFSIKDGGLQGMPPVSMIFGSKAAPGYFIAKAIIKYINEVSILLKNDPEARDRVAVYFVSNYDVPYAEKLIPAADISEQISLAGTEASGTGNMKLMMNGAVTLGTYDGANVEIFEQAGEENNYVFGARLEQVEALGGAYCPQAIYENNPRIRRVVDTLSNGMLSDGGSGVFRDLYNYLLFGPDADRYKVLLDFEDYCNTKVRALYDYNDRLAFGRKGLMNVARSGEFSSDRCILEYAGEIWKIQK